MWSRVAVRGQLHALHREPEPGAELAEHGEVAGRPVAEGEVGPDHDRGGVQAFDEHLVGELGGRHAGQLDGERQHEEGVDAQLRHQVRTAAQAGEPGRVAAGADDLGRVRVEGDQHGGQAALPALRDRRADQLLVAAVHPVEHPDGDDAASPSGRHPAEPTPPLHVREPTERGGPCERRPVPQPDAGASTTTRPGGAVTLGHEGEDPAVRGEDAVRPGHPGGGQRAAVGEVGGRGGVDVEPGERGGHGVGQRQGQARRVLQLGQRPGVREVERSDPGAPQRGEVPADPQRRTEVAGQRPHVGAGRALHGDVEVGAAPGEQRERLHRDGPRRQHHVLPRPHPRVGPPPVDLDRADRAGHLQDRARQRGDRRRRRRRRRPRTDRPW